MACDTSLNSESVEVLNEHNHMNPSPTSKTPWPPKTLFFTIMACDTSLNSESVEVLNEHNHMNPSPTSKTPWPPKTLFFTIMACDTSLNSESVEELNGHHYMYPSPTSKTPDPPKLYFLQSCHVIPRWTRKVLRNWMVTITWIPAPPRRPLTPQNFIFYNHGMWYLVELGKCWGTEWPPLHVPQPHIEDPWPPKTLFFTIMACDTSLNSGGDKKLNRQNQTDLDDPWHSIIHTIHKTIFSIE
jgi:hypothetical protein